MRILLPYIPDKKTVNLIGKTYYPELLEAGVHIYEYTPGFVHSKVVEADGNIAAVGTINLDFRSLYLHYECACLIFENDVLKISPKISTELSPIRIGLRCRTTKNESHEAICRTSPPGIRPAGVAPIFIAAGPPRTAPAPGRSNRRIRNKSVFSQHSPGKALSRLLIYTKDFIKNSEDHHIIPSLFVHTHKYKL